LTLDLPPLSIVPCCFGGPAIGRRGARDLCALPPGPCPPETSLEMLLWSEMLSEWE